MNLLYMFVEEGFDWPGVLRSLPAWASTIVVLTRGQEFGPVPQLRGKTIALRSLDAYGCSEPEARRKTMRWLREWANQPFLEGATIKELFLYRGVSLWWFFDPWWALRGATSSSYLHEKFRCLEQIAKILEERRPRKVVSLCRGTEFNAVLKTACRYRGVDVSCPSVAWENIKESLRCKLHALLYPGRSIARMILHWLQAILAPRVIENPARGSLLFLTGDNWGSFWDHENGGRVEGDTYLYHVVRALKKNFSVRFVIELSARKLAIPHLWSRRKKSGILQRPYEAYLDQRALAAAVRGFFQVRRIWKRIARSKELRSSLSYDGVACWDLVGPQLTGFLGAHLFDALLTLEIALSAMEREKPEALIVDSRMSRYGRAFIHAARCAEVPAIAVEHSFFLPDNVWDFLTAGDVREARRNPALACPLPDKILVYGPRDKELLIQQHFPEERIEVTGAPRWDSLPALTRALDKVALCRSYGLDPGRPIVLLATQAYYPETEENEIFRAACVAVRKIFGAQLAVKLHPLDRTLSATKKRYLGIARKVGLSNVVIRDGRVLYEMLRICDVVLTLGCNTAVEASLMGKPVVVVDLFRRAIRETFLNHFALLEARDEDEILRLLAAILFDSNLQEEQASLGAKFVSLYCYCGDGRAWQRVKNVIQEQAGLTREEPFTASPEPTVARSSHVPEVFSANRQRNRETA